MVVHNSSVDFNKELQAFAYRQHTIKVFWLVTISSMYGLSGASGEKNNLILIIITMPHIVKNYNCWTRLYLISLIQRTSVGR